MYLLEALVGSRAAKTWAVLFVAPEWSGQTGITCFSFCFGSDPPMDEGTTTRFLISYIYILSSGLRSTSASGGPRSSSGREAPQPMQHKENHKYPTWSESLQKVGVLQIMNVEFMTCKDGYVNTVVETCWNSLKRSVPNVAQHICANPHTKHHKIEVIECKVRQDNAWRHWMWSPGYPINMTIIAYNNSL